MPSNLLRKATLLTFAMAAVSACSIGNLVEPDAAASLCPSHASLSCQNGDLYWVDGCGKAEGMSEDCSAGCTGSSCDVAGCTAHSTSQCSAGDVYWYDSCGNRQDIKQDCTTSCTGGACDAVAKCVSHASEQCSAGDVYWYDSCGAKEDIKQDCAAGCTGTTCDAAPGCTANNSFQCYSGDVYWYDSCGNRQTVKQACASHSCTGTTCDPVVCSSHSTYQCSSGSVYWYDSCGNREGVKDACTTGCTGNACNPLSTRFSSTMQQWAVPAFLTDGAQGAFDTSNTAGGNIGTHRWSTLDINGDGRPDLVATSSVTNVGGNVRFRVYGYGTASTYWQVWLNTGSGFATSPTTWSVPNLASDQNSGTFDIAYTNQNAGTQQWLTLDMNGDGRPDLVSTATRENVAGTNHDLVYGHGTASPYWQVWLNTGSGFSSTASVWAVPNLLADYDAGVYTTANVTGSRTHRARWYTLDLDGDGRVDLVSTGTLSNPYGLDQMYGYGTANTYWQVWKNTGSGFAATATNWSTPSLETTYQMGTYAIFHTPSGNATTGAQRWSTIDLTGDGRPELVSTAVNVFDVVLRARVYGYNTASPYWRVWVNTGTGFSSSESTWLVPHLMTDSDYGTLDTFYASGILAGSDQWTTTHLRGNRLPDLVNPSSQVNVSGFTRFRVWGFGTASPSWRIFTNTGAGFVTSAATWSVPNVTGDDVSGAFSLYASGSNGGSQRWSTFDINGDGRPDFVSTSVRSGAFDQVYGNGTASPYWQVWLSVP